MSQLVEGEDFYWENGFLVMTAKYHIKRGYCCKSGCRHCPYRKKCEPQNQTVTNDEGSATNENHIFEQISLE